MQIDTEGYELLDFVEDTITGATGTIVGIHEYLTGCVRVTIQPRIEKAPWDGKVPETIGSDVNILRLITAGPNHAEEPPTVDRSTGGPRQDPAPRFDDPHR